MYGCSTSPEKTPAQQDTTVTKKPAEEISTVEIKGMKFVPDTITVKKGTKLIFINRDIVAHCVTQVGSSQPWTSHSIAAGDDWMLTADSTADYYCAIHKVMTGKIIVKP
jgi:plastocyanin